MKKIVRITESGFDRLVVRVIKEGEESRDMEELEIIISKLNWEAYKADTNEEFEQIINECGKLHDGISAGDYSLSQSAKEYLDDLLSETIQVCQDRM